MIEAKSESSHYLEIMKNSPLGVRSFYTRQDAMVLCMNWNDEIPRTDKDYDMESYEREKLTIASDLNEFCM
jgi:hypothetical protein